MLFGLTGRSRRRPGRRVLADRRNLAHYRGVIVLRALVTGCAGFIGSHISEALLAGGNYVRGVDSFDDFYGPEMKRANIKALVGAPDFELVAEDLLALDVVDLLDDVDVVFHLAAQPGVRTSWGAGFDRYVRNNLLVTQRLLEGAVESPLQRFIYSSSSSVYGESDIHPATEGQAATPRSPYGVTKLAAEHLCRLYASNWNVPTVSLRYFTVYGSRQRPDMAIHRLGRAALEGMTFTLFGDGSQVRDFTHVADVVEANLSAASADLPPGLVANIAGGAAASLNEVIEMVERATGRSIDIRRGDEQAGDVRRTGGAVEVARRWLAWEPKMSLAVGIAEQMEWHLATLATADADRG